MKRICFSFMLPLIILAACKPKTTGDLEELARRSVTRDVVSVSSVRLVPSVFYHEIVSNGKVRSGEKATITFPVSGTVEAIHVANGQRVRQGDLLAEIDDFSYSTALTRARLQFEKAEVNLMDELIKNRSGRSDTAGVSPNVLKMARLRSGYDEAIANLREAEYNLQHTLIRAPLAGVIAGLKAQQWNHTSSYQHLCTIINDTKMEVVFPLLESEYRRIEEGMPVSIIPYNGDTAQVKGVITNVDPMVDANGMIEVTAACSKDSRGLVDGMNVKVIVRKALPGQLVIPKEAVVIRQGKEVVFVRQDSLAIWKYVTTAFENSTGVTITEGLAEGDLVIWKGNLNLAHETKVKELTEK